MTFMYQMKLVPTLSSPFPLENGTEAEKRATTWHGTMVKTISLTSLVVVPKTTAPLLSILAEPKNHRKWASTSQPSSSSSFTSPAIHFRPQSISARNPFPPAILFRSQSISARHGSHLSSIKLRAVTFSLKMLLSGSYELPPATSFPWL